MSEVTVLRWKHQFPFKLMLNTIEVGWETAWELYEGVADICPDSDAA